MSFAFKVLVDEKWFDHTDDLPKGVRLLMKPVDDDAKDMATELFHELAQFDGEKVDWEHPDTIRAGRAYDIALMAASCLRWEGIGNADGSAALPMTIEASRAVFGQGPIFRPMTVGFLEPYHYRTAEKNGSSPLPNSITAGAGGETENSPSPLPEEPSGASSETPSGNSTSAD
jgi:hypothetical protein